MTRQRVSGRNSRASRTGVVIIYANHRIVSFWLIAVAKGAALARGMSLHSAIGASLALRDDILRNKVG